ncbi:cupin domain-containing protein [Paenibacillus sp. sptzw28]|uniref:cupin domain-containing protein n=1 Tax=Paenibacillus sp. sptzw28 TaxID=715179 RepID=UPI001C6EFF1C|nr:cupin domain-containing protein [Paenibacillus sp. sptzw28]QYR21604.1 cupin domain-containing protein [Paenibacillus sp. sptzw28]
MISKHIDIKPFEIVEGVHFHELLTKEMGPKTIIAGLATFKPGLGLACHIHNVEESVTILKGSAYCDVEGERTLLQPYDTSFIPAGIAHRLENASTSDELVIIWVYSQIDETFKPVDIERIYVDADRCMLPKKAVNKSAAGHELKEYVKTV